MPQCCVPQCNNRSENCDLSFYRFPTAETDKNKWLKAIKRHNFIPTTNSRVCSWHFPVGKTAGPLRFAWNINNFLESPSPEKRRRKPNGSHKNHRQIDHSKQKKQQEEKTSLHVNPLVVLAQVALQDAGSGVVLTSFDSKVSISNSSKQDVNPTQKNLGHPAAETLLELMLEPVQVSPSLLMRPTHTNIEIGHSNNNSDFIF